MLSNYVPYGVLSVGYSTSHCFSNAIIGITRTHVHALGHIKIVQQDEKNFCLANMQWTISENTIIPVLLFVSPNFAYCKHCFQCFLGLIQWPQEKQKQCLCKIWADKQRVLSWYFPKWPMDGCKKAGMIKKKFPTEYFR